MPSPPLTSIRQITEGALISFRTKNANDTAVWQGTLESIGTFRSIQSIFNPQSYNEAVRQQDASIPSDIKMLTYFTITVSNKSSTATTMVFADEWIQDGSLHELSLGTKVTLVVDDPKNDSQAIVSLLSSVGYACKIIPNR
jgi:hypothetical protein